MSAWPVTNTFILSLEALPAKHRLTADCSGCALVTVGTQHLQALPIQPNWKEDNLIQQMLLDQNLEDIITPNLHILLKHSKSQLTVEEEEFLSGAAYRKNVPTLSTDTGLTSSQPFTLTCN